MTALTTVKSPRQRPKTNPRSQAGAAQPTPARHCVGLISACDGDDFTLSSGTLQARVRRAASCLLVPRVGDTVACLLVAPDEAWVLAVLQREEATAEMGSETVYVLRCPGPTRIEVEAGALTLAAPALALQTTDFLLRADKATVTAGEAQFIGKDLHLIGTAVKAVGSMLSTVFDRVSHFSRSHLRTTEGIDRVQATHLECEAQQLARISGEHLLLNGQNLIKARGAQIHFG